VTFGIFNDDTYMTNEKGETLSVWKLVLNLIYGVLKIFGGSALLGTCLGAIYTLIAHWADMRNNKKGQILNIFAASYLTYALAESVAMSGIIAEMFCALLMGIYMRPHLSAGGSMLTTFFVEQVAALADAAICLLIGISVVQLTSKGWYFGLWVMLFCLIGRFLSV
jgi:NhaP-type Na+/H+ or K+/H+ antiporter